MSRKEIIIFFKKNLFLVVSIAFFIIYYLNAFKLPERAIVFPRIVLFVAAPVVIWNIIGSIIDIKKEIIKNTFTNELEQSLQEEQIFNPILKDSLIILAMTFVYILIMSVIGYFVSTSFYILVVLLFYKIKKPLRILLYIAGINIFLYLVFVLWVGIRFPRGLLI